MTESKHTVGVELRAKDLASRELRNVGSVGKRAGESIAAGFLKAQIAFGALRVAARAVFRALKDVTFGAAAQGDQFAKMSKKIGVSVESLSAMAHVAGLSGTSFEGLANGMKLLAKNAYDASKGTGEAKDVFAELGIAVKDAAGKLRPIESLFMDIADRMAAMENETTRAAYAQKLFGRSGLELIPILEGGSKAIREGMREAKALGVVWTDVAAKNAEDFSDAFERVEASIQGVKNAIAVELFPVLTPMFEKLAKTIAANREAIGKWVKEFVEEAVPFIRDEVIPALKSLSEIIWGVAKAAGALYEASRLVGTGLGTWVRELSGIPKVVGLNAQARKRLAEYDDPLRGMIPSYPIEMRTDTGLTRLPEMKVTAGQPWMPKEINPSFWERFLQGAQKAKQEMVDLSDFARELGEGTVKKMTDAFAGFFDAIVFGAASASEAFRAMALDMLRYLNQLAMHELFAQVFGMILGSAGSGVSGAGTGTKTIGGETYTDTSWNPDFAWASGSGKGLMVTQNIYPSTGMNEEQLAGAVVKKLKTDTGYRNEVRRQTKGGLYG